MVDVKKLITGFLIVGSAAAGSGLILAAVQIPSSAQTPASPQIAGVADDTQTPVGDNAFVQDSDSQDDFSVINSLAQSITEASSDDPNNLTDVLADSYMNGFMAANPDGPQDDANGNPTVTNPDTESIAMAVASTTAMNDLEIPDWNLEAESQIIKTSSDTSPTSISQYSNALNTIVNNRFIATGITAMINAQTADPTKAPYIQSQIAGALSDALALSVPTPLITLQKSLVKVLVYEKNTVALLNTVNDDPLRTSLILSGEKDDYNAAVQDLGTQMQNAATIQGFAFGVAPNAPSQHNSVAALFDTIVGVKTANAQWETFDPANFGEWISEFVNDIILQILKNILMALIQKKVLAWVQGAGLPRFITSWATTFVNAYTQTALNAINSQMTCIYPTFMPQIRLNLTAFYKPASNNVCANTFQAALNGHTFQQFYNNFANGGWISYGASMLPSGNYYGGLAFQAQIVDQNAQSQKQATVQKATANQGLNGDQSCGAGNGSPTGFHVECADSDGALHNANAGGTCSAGYTAVDEPNNGLCNDGSEPIVTSPGTFTGYGVNSAIDSTPKLVAAADSINGLLDAVTDSLVSALINAATNAVVGGPNGGGASGGGITSIASTTIQGGGANTTQPLALTCNPSTQNASTTVGVTFGSIGGKSDANGNPPNYFWTSTTGDTGSGSIFTTSSSIPGTYTITLTDSTGDAPATCRVVVLP